MKRVGIKQQPWMKDAAARRQRVIQQQKQARRDLTALARQLAVSEEPLPNDHNEVEGMEVVVTSERSKKKTREERVKQRREHFSQQLMVPEWMVDVPIDLNGSGSTDGHGWIVVPRPEGKRCIVIANNGVTIARTQSGSILHKFPSVLPNGSRKTLGGMDAYCILDCIFHESDSTFYVLDVMCWKGYLLYNCSTEFRLYWLLDKLTETGTNQVTPTNPFSIQALPWYECDEQGIYDAYTTTFSFTKDGLRFAHKATHYELGLSPLILVWKDALSSRFFIHSDKPSIVLRLNENGQFTTLEGIVLFTPHDPSFCVEHDLSEGDLAKFSFDEGYFGEDNTPHLLGITFNGRSSPQRPLADSWTKILFQYNARSGGVTISDILEVARHPPMIET